LRIDIALIIIDMQVGVFDGSIVPSVFRADNLLANVVQLIEKARKSSIPIIFVQHKGDSGHPLEYQSRGWHIHPELSILDEDLVVEKQTPDSFFNTDLQDNLVSKNINRLVIAGIQTEFCIDTTCRRAFSMGYEVTLVEDAHSTWDTDQLTASQIINHHNSSLSEWFVTLEKVNEINLH